MPADFWAGWVFALTAASVLALIWFVFSIYFGNGERKQAEQAERAESESPVWDGDLREGDHPAPMWWFWLILASLVFSVVYLMLYPGLGSYSGALQWSQGGRFEESRADWQALFGPSRAVAAEAPLAELQCDTALMATAERLFARECAACHGADAQGQARLFPNLLDDEWQWGGTPHDIETSIRNGRTAVMVGWSAALGDDGVAQVVDYLRQMPAGPPPEHPGQAHYDRLCVACHGPDGRGQPLLGGPDLANDIYLYGGDAAALEESVRNGRSGEMPAFGERLDDLQIRLLVAWLSREGAGG